MSKTVLTQVGEALARLGIEHIPSYSPQARGRSERMNRTLQDRLVNELSAAGITTMEAANRLPRERYIPTHNEEFACEAADPISAFVGLGEVDLDEIFFEDEDRTVGKDNTVSLEGAVLQIDKQPGRRTCAGLAVQVRRHLDGGYTIRRGSPAPGLLRRGGPGRAPEPSRSTRRTPGSTNAAQVDSRVVPAISSYRPSSGRAAAARSASLRSPPAPSGWHSDPARAHRRPSEKRTDHLSKPSGHFTCQQQEGRTRSVWAFARTGACDRLGGCDTGRLD